MPMRSSITCAAVLAFSVAFALHFLRGGAASHATEAAGAQANPKAAGEASDWGDDHVDRPTPEFVTGDECLFCHRDIGKTWATNRHQLSIRLAEPVSDAMKPLAKSATSGKFAGEVQYEMGHVNRVRYLKTGEQYGHLDLLTAQWSPPAARRESKLIDNDNANWDNKTFGESCAGCHATAVDPTTHAFALLSLDCYVCHGDVPLEHSKETSLVHLAKARKDEPRVIVSICGQCHVRTGKSKSLGTPYPNNFVAGDNLFRDFEVDWSQERLNRLNPADRHILENVRDVAVSGRTDVTCLSCHDVHMQSDKRHQTLARNASCVTCHDAENFKRVKRYEVHSETCRY